MVWEDGQVQVVPEFAEIIERQPELVLVDIPIGLTETGSRRPDVEARAFLKERGCCVFPALLRGMLDCESFESACEYGRRLHGKAVTLQCWHITPKIKEVDEVVRRKGQQMIREGHPEVSFTLMNGGQPLGVPKRRPAGRDIRLELLDHHFSGIREEVKRHHGIQSDLIDAFAMLWSARRIANGTARVFPESSARDSRGLLMRIWA